MKSKKVVFIEGDIIFSRVSGETGSPFCIHIIRFKNGKYAIIRAASGICFKPGDILQRTDNEWLCDYRKIRLLPFEYLNEEESRRQFIECY
ncbi:hypothetical protein M8013_05370 [Enterobacteriaceae bacterium H4N4]|uniref:Uncharacterized protein n=1 Tax=Silvania confinis TaxID=2926470 RepID=A0A9J6QD64_9ENTR|nr:hypothetical protein [Silvania confinis]MCU6668187.1 hypothetical protein [Silvania confinis]